jgi:hypothetical protein
MRNLVTRAFQRNPAARYQSATDMLAELQPLRQRIQDLNPGDVQALSGNELGEGVRIGGWYRASALRVLAGIWTRYYDLGWARSGWLYHPERTCHFAETFFKVHLFADGKGYCHVLASADPPHVVWLETAAGDRFEETLCWSEGYSYPRTTFWRFAWKRPGGEPAEGTSTQTLSNS